MPRRAKTDPNSRPITPAPIIVKVSGHSFKDKASVEVITLFLSKSIKLGTIGFEPVAKTIFLLFIIFLSSPFVTSTSPS